MTQFRVIQGKASYKLYQLCKTGWTVIIMSLIWQVLEMIFYGEIQSRKVDTIMIILFTPFIWKFFLIKKLRCCRLLGAGEKRMIWVR